MKFKLIIKDRISDLSLQEKMIHSFMMKRSAYEINIITLYIMNNCPFSNCTKIEDIQKRITKRKNAK